MPDSIFFSGNVTTNTNTPVSGAAGPPPHPVPNVTITGMQPSPGALSGDSVQVATFTAGGAHGFQWNALSGNQVLAVRATDASSGTATERLLIMGSFFGSAGGRAANFDQIRLDDQYGNLIILDDKTKVVTIQTTSTTIKMSQDSKTIEINPTPRIDINGGNEVGSGDNVTISGKDITINFTDSYSGSHESKMSAATSITITATSNIYMGAMKTFQTFAKAFSLTSSVAAVGTTKEVKLYAMLLNIMNGAATLLNKAVVGLPKIPETPKFKYIGPILGMLPVGFGKESKMEISTLIGNVLIPTLCNSNTKESYNVRSSKNVNIHPGNFDLKGSGGLKIGSMTSTLVSAKTSSSEMGASGLTLKGPKVDIDAATVSINGATVEVG